MTPEPGRPHDGERDLDRAFEFADSGDTVPARAPAGRALPPDDLRTPVSLRPTPTPPSPRRGPAAEAAASTTVLTPPPLRVLRRFSYLLGAVMAATVPLVWMNPSFGVVRAWPWETFLLRGADGTASLHLTWGSDQAFVVEWTLATLGLLVAAVMPGGRARGTLAIVLLSVAFAIFYVRMDEAVEDYFATSTALALIVAGVMWLRVAPGRPGARAVLAAGWLVAAAGGLLLPYPNRHELATGGRSETVESEFAGFYRQVTDPPPDTTTRRILWDPPAFAMYAFGGAMLVGLLAFLGFGGGWAGWASVFFLFVYVVCLPIRHHFAAVFPTGPNPVAADWEEGLRNTVALARLRFIPFLFPLMAAILDLALARRRPVV